MTNPFQARSVGLDGPATDILPVVPHDTTALAHVAISLFIETGGTVSIQTVAGAARVVSVADHSFLPVGVTHVRATGTTATGIHALVLA